MAVPSVALSSTKSGAWDEKPKVRVVFKPLRTEPEQREEELRQEEDQAHGHQGESQPFGHGKPNRAAARRRR